MAKPLAVGDKVQCRLFNTPEGKFYGESWVGKIVHLVIGRDIKNPILYTVTRNDPDRLISLKRKEILRRVK